MAARLSTRQIPLAGTLALSIGAALSAIGNGAMYVSDRWAVNFTAEEIGASAVADWRVAVTGRGLIGTGLSLATLAIGLYLARRSWRATPRHDFAIALGVIGGLAAFPFLWSATIAVAEFFFER